MTETIRFQPGQTIFIREVSIGKVRRACPYIVVQDKAELMAFYVPANTVTKYPFTVDGKRLRPIHRLKAEWELTDLKWNQFSMLRLTIPGENYSVIIFWGYPSKKHDAWYINLEEPLKRIPGGFEFNDQFLDVIVEADLSSWHWKDEDEFAEAVDLKLISQEKAKAIREEGIKVSKWIQSGKSPFNRWEKWRPDPSWKIPVLPEGWDKI
jgi:predicted RNA-binding protein associated with RNAse of E/G family